MGGVTKSQCCAYEIENNGNEKLNMADQSSTMTKLYLIIS